MKAHCLFEQSGTFKNEFKKFGIDAYDYDILNQFNETDYQIDLFKEIRGGYANKKSIFDDMSKNDIIMAFFPCVRFCHQVRLEFQGNNYGYRDWPIEKKLERSRQLFKELAEYYDLVTKLVIVCLRKGLRLIIENPKSTTHILTDYWPIKAQVIDYDRSKRGDYYKKPTQYWFINCEPTNNFIFGEKFNYNKKDSVISRETTVNRSMIHPEYANSFIRKFVLSKEQLNGTRKIT